MEEAKEIVIPGAAPKAGTKSPAAAGVERIKGGI
jgi:hypothetical protein